MLSTSEIDQTIRENYVARFLHNIIQYDTTIDVFMIRKILFTK